MNDCLLFPADGKERSRSPVILSNARELTDDLQLELLWKVMSGGDTFKAEAARRVMLDERETDGAVILYRQAVLRDIIAHTFEWAEIYRHIRASLLQYEKHLQDCKPSFARFSPMSVRVRDAAVGCGLLLNGAERAAEILSDTARLSASEGCKKVSDAFTAFYDKPFLLTAKAYTNELEALAEDTVIQYGVRLGPGFKGAGYVVRSIQKGGTQGSKAKKNTATIPLTSVGLQAQASGLYDAGLVRLLRALNEINTQTRDTLSRLCQELAFYLGAATLYKNLRTMGQPCYFPEIAERSERAFSFVSLADAALAIGNHRCPVANSADLTDQNTVLITGANQGGKSTFLRSIGLAALMARCGLFVAAERLTVSLPGRLFTHFCRGENAAPNSGRLDEELNRMSGIIDQISPGDWLLMNESFSTTSEREGARIAGEIIPGLRTHGIRVIFVTHLTEYARRVYVEAPSDAVFLRAGRDADGIRSFVISPGAPEPTGFGLDLYCEMIE